MGKLDGKLSLGEVDAGVRSVPGKFKGGAINSIASYVRRGLQLAALVEAVVTPVFVGGCAVEEPHLNPAPEKVDDDDATDVVVDDDDMHGDDDDTAQPVNDLGTWFWDPSVVAMDSDAWLAAVDVVNARYNHVYNSASNESLEAGAQPANPGDLPDPVASWNYTLSSLGIDSDLLIGENNILCDLTALDDRVQAFADFQNARELEGERFRGFHLDLEPHALDSSICSGYTTWDEADRATKLNILGVNFVYVLSQIRQKLDDSGMSETPIEIDLPVWFDVIYNPEDGSGLWDTIEDRNSFFERIAEQVNGITFLSYCRNNSQGIIDSISDEVSALPDGFPVRLGLNAKDVIGGNGECETWGNLEQTMLVADDLQSRGYPVDVHALDYLMQQEQ